MKRAENPILLWLIAKWGFMADNSGTMDGAIHCNGLLDAAQRQLHLCRWLDAEDEWALNLQYIRDGNKHLDWVMWREARMAEAGVL